MAAEQIIDITAAAAIKLERLFIVVPFWHEILESERCEVQIKLLRYAF
jgi:hypothetical protein